MASLIENIQAISENVIQNQPSANFGRVIRYYDDTVTVETDDGVLENIKCVNVPQIGSPCVLVPVRGEFVCIPNDVDEYTKEEIDQIIEEIITGKIEVDIDLDMNLMDNGYLKICVSIIKKKES